MSEYSAKSLREKMKAKARSLASEKDQKVDSSDWSPAPLLRAEVKTGARPIMKPSAKGTGESYAARDTKKAIGGDMKRGGFKAGGRIKRADGGSSDKKYVNIGGKRVEDTPEAKLAFAKKTFPNITEVGPNAEPIFPKAKAAGGSTKGVKIPSAKETLSTKEIVGSNSIRPTRGAAGHYKKGGAVKDAGIKEKKALGAIDPSPKRAAASHYKRGGKAEGGGLASKLNELTGYKSPAQKQQEGMPDPSKNVSVDYRKMKPDTDKLDRMSSPYKKGGRTAKATGGSLMGALTGAKKKVSKKGGKTNINIVINAGKPAPRHPAEAMPPAAPKMMAPPPPPMDAGAPPPAMPPMGPPPGAGPMMPPDLPIGRKAGGRITKVASSYKDMQAGAASGEGRLQKTEIAERHKDAPARKVGGRISKVAKSYKDMTAGAASGEGRLQKEDIAKAKAGRGK